MLLATGGILTSAVTGCLGTSQNSRTTPQPAVDVEVEFSFDLNKDGNTVEQDLVLSHTRGDVLQSGRTVYVTIGGEEVAEKTLNSDVHAGGEIIRVAGDETGYDKTRTVALYLRRKNQPQELAVKNIDFPPKLRLPDDDKVNFDFDATGDTVTVKSESWTPSSGDQLTVNGDVSNDTIVWHTPVEGSGTSVTLSESVDSTGKIVTVSNISTSGDSITVTWTPTDGSPQKIGSWEAP